MAVLDELPSIQWDFIIFILATSYLFLLNNSVLRIVYAVTFGGLFFVGFISYVYVQPSYKVSLVPLLYFVIFFAFLDRNFIGFDSFSPKKSLPFSIYPLFILFCLFGIVLHEAFYYVAVGVFGYISVCESRSKCVYFSAMLILITLLLFLINWSGFGRLNVVSSGLVITLSILSRARLRTSRWFIFSLFSLSAISTPFMSLLRFDFLQLNDVGIEIVLNDSAFHHLILFPDIFYSYNKFDIVGFFGQIVLFLLNWFPRDLFGEPIWNSKPIGIGYYFVDSYLSRETTGEGFSVSVGFLGELFSTLQNLWFLGYLFYIYFFVKLLQLFKNEYYYRVWFIYLASFLPSFIWGGGALYGSRVWWFALPFASFFLVLRYLSIRKF